MCLNENDVKPGDQIETRDGSLVVVVGIMPDGAIRFVVTESNTHEVGYVGEWKNATCHFLCHGTDGLDGTKNFGAHWFVIV